MPNPFKRHLVATTDKYTYNGQIVLHEFDDYGNHRIVDPTGEVSGWRTYRGIANIGPWYATTDYYTGELPHLFRITEIKPA